MEKLFVDTNMDEMRSDWDNHDMEIVRREKRRGGGGRGGERDRGGEEVGVVGVGVLVAPCFPNGVPVIFIFHIS